MSLSVGYYLSVYINAECNAMSLLGKVKSNDMYIPTSCLVIKAWVYFTSRCLCTFYYNKPTVTNSVGKQFQIVNGDGNGIDDDVDEYDVVI